MPEEKQATEVMDDAPFADGSTDLAQLTEEQWAEWEKTGEMPSKDGKKPEAKEAKAAEESQGTEKPAVDGDKPPASQADTHRQDREPTEAEKRIKQLLGQVKERDDEIAKLKTPKAAETKVERAKPTMQDKNADGTSKYPATDEGFEKYTDDMLDWKQEQREAKTAAERAESEKTQREAKVAEIRKKQVESWLLRVEESKKLHDDFEEVALAKELPIVENSIPDHWFLRSPQGSELLYHFGKNKAELVRINKLHPDDQLRELITLEKELAKPAVNKVTRASKPPSEVGARQASNRDVVKDAVENDDYEAFAAEENRRDIARMGGKR